MSFNWHTQLIAASNEISDDVMVSVVTPVHEP